MPLVPILRRSAAAVVAAAACFVPACDALAEVSDLRKSAVVTAVHDARSAVVNIQGQKTVHDATERAGDHGREVNGMGTGVVIDPRGYILTNFHVVDGVRQINVTLEDRRAYVAKLVANDAATDLAVIKVQVGRSLPVINIGSSSDLMPGESVIAVGNAYGYEHTVTRGIVSALHRDVQVSDTQSYEDLVQTDASINPGNSGGPLLNIEGRMIGVNVAVRAGAQGIGFAIPVDRAMEVAAKLMSVERLERKWHGIETAAIYGDETRLVVRRVESNSPAERSGLRAGDVIRRIGEVTAHRPLDIELALLDQEIGAPIDLEVERGDTVSQVTLELAPSQSRRMGLASTAAPSARDAAAWEVIGLALSEEPRSTFVRQRSRYRGGLRVTAVRDGGPAAQQGIRIGDILVGMHRWETASTQDIRYIVERADLSTLGPVKFYILRGDETLFGHMSVATTRQASSLRR